MQLEEHQKSFIYVFLIYNLCSFRKFSLTANL